MRHRKNNVKFGRSKAHREALVSMLVVGLIKAKSIRTTARKAKVARPLAEKLEVGQQEGVYNVPPILQPGKIHRAYRAQKELPPGEALLVSPGNCSLTHVPSLAPHVVTGCPNLSGRVGDASHSS